MLAAISEGIQQPIMRQYGQRSRNGAIIMMSLCLALPPVILRADQGQPDRYGPKLGLGVNSLLGAEVGYPRRRPALGFTAGGFFHFDLGPRLSFGFEILLNQKGWGEGRAGQSKKRIGLYYAEAPVLLMLGNRARDTVYFGIYRGLFLEGFRGPAIISWSGRSRYDGQELDRGYILGVTRRISIFQIDMRLTSGEPFLSIHGKIRNRQVRIMLARVIEL